MNVIINKPILVADIFISGILYGRLDLRIVHKDRLLNTKKEYKNSKKRGTLNIFIKKSR